VKKEFSIAGRRGFSLVEVLVVVSLLSLIVLALMTVFNSTQSAFRTGVTQTDVLEGGRAAMDLMVSDLKTMTPSGGTNNGAVNLFTSDNSYNYYFVAAPSLAYAPLLQSLPGVTDTTTQRTNLLNYFFFLSRQNTKWIGIGYAVDSTNSSPLYPLYRYYAETNISQSPVVLFNGFINYVYNGQWTNMSHLIDGVVDLRLRAYDPNGIWLTNGYAYLQPVTVKNVQFFQFSPQVLPSTRELGLAFFSNAIPASVELQMGVLEDRPLQRASSLPIQSAQSNYLSQQAGQVHVFRQRVILPNVDPTAYQ
jgi:prepilin-type N-terminal cleavage/methylation domain-containing protein